MEMRMSELAKRIGRHPDTIRAYEKKGVIPEAKRDIAGQRIYTEQDLAEIRAILLGEAKEAISA